MPSPGLSLVGFMDQAQAIHHLRDFCVPADPSEPALIAEWRAAAARLGPPVANAGLPGISPTPDAHQPYIAQVARLPKVAPMLAGNPNLGFAMVEIDPLLSFQFTVKASASTQHDARLDTPPSMEQLLEICLPLQQAPENSRIARGPQSILLKTPSLNVRLESAGVIGPGVLGVKFGIDLPLVRVVRHNGRCYLRNGFHRAFGLRKAGATHMPCLFRDNADLEAVGIRQDGTTFAPAMMASTNAPTLAHFTSGRAHEVSLRSMSKILHISWSEHVVAEDV
ncbi:MAG TPA: hypothetical protein VK753_01815 [Xanthomonadaceae bacterium]|jgi:hypothetical protein|nr:hypothetical protein [Xanthomonadaceae bacterium]